MRTDFLPFLAALAIAVGAQVTVPMVPVPMTLQTLAVLVAGILLGPRRGATAAVMYLALVVVGLPVLADGGRAGWTAFLQLKSAGYVVGFIPGAAVAGVLGYRKGWRRALQGGLAAHGVVLVVGGAVLAWWIGLSGALEYGVVPFLPGAVVKSALAACAVWIPVRRGR